MATSKSAEKRARQNENRRKYNKSWKTRFRTVRKELGEAIEAEADEETIRELETEAVSLADKVASRGIVHDKKAARWKSRLQKQVSKYLD